MLCSLIASEPKLFPHGNALSKLRATELLEIHPHLRRKSCQSLCVSSSINIDLVDCFIKWSRCPTDPSLTLGAK